MVKRTVEIDDDLDQRVESLREDIKNNLIDFLKDNPDMEDWDTYYQKSGCDAVNEIADSATPIYYSGIDGLYYLYGSEFEEAYKNAGIGNGDEANHKAVAICCYLQEKGFDYLRELEEMFDEAKIESPEKAAPSFFKRLKAAPEKTKEVKS